jgi:hypothetical protein
LVLICFAAIKSKIWKEKIIKIPASKILFSILLFNLIDIKNDNKPKIGKIKVNDILNPSTILALAREINKMALIIIIALAIIQLNV